MEYLYNNLPNVKSIMDYTNLPPIIENLIHNLHDQNQPLHIRNNYKLMLLNIQEACTKELAKYHETSVITLSHSSKPRKKRSR